MTTQNKRSPAYTDLDKITFGKYKGEILQDVPASYLVWLWNDNLKDFSRNEASKYPNIQQKIMLANYIWNSKDAIEMETGESI